MGLLYSLKVWEKSADFWKGYKGLYVEKVLLPWAEEAKNYLHISKKVMEVDSKVVLIMSNGLVFQLTVLAISLDTRLG